MFLYKSWLSQCIVCTCTWTSLLRLPQSKQFLQICLPSRLSGLWWMLRLQWLQRLHGCYALGSAGMALVNSAQQLIHSDLLGRFLWRAKWCWCFWSRHDSFVESGFQCWQFGVKGVPKYGFHSDFIRFLSETFSNVFLQACPQHGRSELRFLLCSSPDP